MKNISRSLPISLYSGSCSFFLAPLSCKSFRLISFYSSSSSATYFRLRKASFRGCATRHSAVACVAYILLDGKCGTANILRANSILSGRSRLDQNSCVLRFGTQGFSILKFGTNWNMLRANSVSFPIVRVRDSTKIPASCIPTL